MKRIEKKENKKSVADKLYGNRNKQNIKAHKKSKYFKKQREKKAKEMEELEEVKKIDNLRH